MNAQGDGGSAFPNNGAWGNGYPEQGMTLRDYFAAHAPVEGDQVYIPSTTKELEAFLGIASGEFDWRIHWHMAVAKARYAYADAMLRARTK